MRRRDVLALLAGAAVCWPIVAVPQPRSIGVLIGLAEDDPEIPARVAAFEQGLSELGWTERNLRIQYRFAAEADRLQVLAKDLVGLQPDVLVASSGFVVSALLRETRTIPIVFVTATDPVGTRLVESQTRPGGNVTGFANNIASMGGKWLELLKEIAPSVARVAVMFNPATAPASESFFMPPFEAAAASLGVVPSAMPIGSPADIDSALAAFGREPNSGLIVMPDNFTSVHRRSIVTQAARHRMPAIYPIRYFATAGGLMSYGADLVDLYRRVPTYVDRILKGASPADLPVLAPAKVDLVINLKAARELGLTVPRIMLARAEEVIE
jgi:putative ABC transport system substrate-binding protein